MMVRKIKTAAARTAGVILLSFMIIACGKSLTNENLLRVKNGMTEKQVKEILGQPAKIESGEVLGLRGSTFLYEKGKTKVQINFINDSVVSKSGNFE